MTPEVLEWIQTILLVIILILLLVPAAGTWRR